MLLLLKEGVSRRFLSSMSAFRICVTGVVVQSHDDKNCDLWINSKGTLKVENQQFGSCLRAAPYTSAGKDVIYVSRYYEDCCEILKYSQVYEQYRSIVGQERGRTHKDLNERRKIKSNLNQINPNLV